MAAIIKKFWDRRKNSVTEDAAAQIEDLQLASCVTTDLQYIFGLQPLDKNTLAVTGGKEGIYLLRKYSYNGKILWETVLGGNPAGLAKITLANQPCLVISYQKENRIDFHKIDDIEHILARMTCPGASVMCAISSSVLAYASVKDGSSMVHFVDCSNDVPVMHNTLPSIKVQQSTVWGMTFKSGNVKFLLVAGHGKVCAYDVQVGGKLLWQLSGQLSNKHPGINPQDVAYNAQTDTILVACLEGYVYEVSRNGKYLRTVLSTTSEIGKACHLIWSTGTTHLILQHNAKNKATISIFGCLNIYSKEEIKDAFKKACFGTKETFKVRLAGIGTYGVGKTSVVHNLLGLPFVDHHVSTQGIHTQLAQADKFLDVKEVGNWNQINKHAVEINAEDIQKEVLLYITRKESSVNGHADAEVKNGSEARVQEQGGGGGEEEDDSRGNMQNIGDQTPDPDEETLGKIRDTLVRKRTNSVPDETTDTTHTFRISIWDFGGQVQFYATHHMFLDPELVYMLVLNITKDLDSVVETQFMGRFDYREVGIPKTVREFVDYWLNTIHGRSKKHPINADERSTELLPPVIIVLTHKDMISDPNKEAYIAKFTKELKKHIDGKPYEPHIDNIFVIDNKNRSKCETEELKNRILELASEQSSWGSPRPVNWLRLERAIHLEAAEQPFGQPEKPFVDIGRVKELATEHNIDDDNLGDFISFHHAVGDLLYFEGTDKVVTKPQWLIDSFSQVITAPEFHEVKELRSFKTQVIRLEKEGVATMDLLHHMWKDDVNFLLHLMVKFGLMIPFDEQECNRSSFYIPCMLPAIDLNHCDQALKENPDWTKLAPAIFYRPNSGFLPIGSFQTLICQCNKLPGWSIHGTVAYNAVLFRVVSHNEILVSLTSRKEGIKLEAWSPSHESTRCLNVYEIRRTFEECLGNACGSTEFTINVCPCENSTEMEFQCLIPDTQFVKENGTKLENAICPKHTRHARILKPDDYKVWFQANQIPDESFPDSPNGTPFGGQSTSNTESEMLIRNFSQRISDQSILYDVGLRLGLHPNKIAEIRTNHNDSIREAGYHVLRFWFQSTRDSSDCSPISSILNQAFSGNVFEGKSISSIKNVSLMSPKHTHSENRCQSGQPGSSHYVKESDKCIGQASRFLASPPRRTLAGQQNTDMILLRELSKLITDENKLEAIGLELGLGINELRRIFFDNRDSIENAGFQVLLRWYEREFPADGSTSVLTELRRVFREHDVSINIDLG